MIALEHEVIETRKAAAELIISMVEHANALGLGPDFLDFLTKKAPEISSAACRIQRLVAARTNTH